MTDREDNWNHEMGCPVGMEDIDLILQEANTAEEWATVKEARYQQRRGTANSFRRDAKKWLAPLIAGGLSAAKDAPIGPTAERLAETILIALENAIRRPGRFSLTETYYDDVEIPF
jgi:hypothetical protein